MPAVLVTTAAGHGFIFGLLRIAWIVVGSIFLYNVASETGQFQKWLARCRGKRAELSAPAQNYRVQSARRLE